VVDGLSYDATSHTIVAATHGRGIWTFDVNQLQSSSTQTRTKH
jgi:hypothetical protein